jgi:hypothetical protein
MRFDKQSNPEKNRFLDSGSEFKFSVNEKPKTLRKVPFGLKLQIFFSDVRGLIGLVFTATGSIFMIVFGSVFLDSASLGLKADSPVVYGVIEAVTPTNTSVNGQTLYKYAYVFEAEGGRIFRGSVKKYAGIAQSGDSIRVRYATDNPAVSGLADYQENAMPWWIMLFLMIFPAVGILLLMFAFKKTKRTAKVLKCGETAWGDYDGQEPTNTRINNQTVYRLFFKFTASDGNEYTAVGTTHKTYRLRDEERELIVYDPQDPKNAFPTDAFPKAVKDFLLKN